MGALHQMGHDSSNLIGDSNLGGYKGAILSPVNGDLAKIKKQVSENDGGGKFEFIFDPQLYAPQNAIDTLKDWPYFPKALATANLSDHGWWFQINDSLVSVMKDIKAKSVCSPAPVPKIYSLEYYDTMVAIGSDLHLKASDNGFDVLQTLLINFDHMSDQNEVNRITSTISKTKCQRIYLIFDSVIEPRRELTDLNCLKGCMKLINDLSEAGLSVTVGFCSSDQILWKAAGAKDCATGKFFNLRRFTKSRFDDDEGGGGGQLPYWFEENFFSFFRETDLLRLRGNGLFDFEQSKNPLAKTIQNSIEGNPTGPWLGNSWRQYMWWFCDFEKKMSADSHLADSILENAEEAWASAGDKRILMDETRNNGKWLRPWRQALREYK